MTSIGIDLGNIRSGVAVAHGQLATSLCILSTADIVDNTPEWQNLLKSNNVDRLVFGLPLLSSGKKGQQAIKTEQVGRRIARRDKLCVDFVDERLTSKMSNYSPKRITKSRKQASKSNKKPNDDRAAVIILQTYLDRQGQS